MKWILIITLFNANGDPISVSYPKSSVDTCERTAGYYMTRYEEEGTKATYECKPNSPFVEAK